MSAAGGNSFEAFLTDMIMAVSRQAAADGKVNPAYTQLAAKLAAAQASSMSGTSRSSYVSPAAGSTPTGRTESAASGKFLAEALTLAAMNLPQRQGAPVQPVPQPAAARALDQMSFTELQGDRGPARRGHGAGQPRRRAAGGWPA